MTNERIEPTNEEILRKSKKVIVDEKSPLLPTSHGESGASGEFNGASFSGAVFNLSTTVVGSGTMALPAAMKVLGLIPGICLVILMAFLTEASIEFLIRFTRMAKSVSHGDLMQDAFGKCGRLLFQLSILINNTGSLVVCMFIIGNFFVELTSVCVLCESIKHC